MLINIYTSVSWYRFKKEIKISTDSGRSCRPLLIASKIDKIEKINYKENTWFTLLGYHENKNISNKESV